MRPLLNPMGTIKYNKVHKKVNCGDSVGIQLTGVEFFNVNRYVDFLLDIYSVKIYFCTEFFDNDEVKSNNMSYYPLNYLDFTNPNGEGLIINTYNAKNVAVYINDVLIPTDKLMYIYHLLRRRKYYWSWYDENNISKNEIMDYLRTNSFYKEDDSKLYFLCEEMNLIYKGELTLAGKSLTGRENMGSNKNIDYILDEVLLRGYDDKSNESNDFLLLIQKKEFKDLIALELYEYYFWNERHEFDLQLLKEIVDSVCNYFNSPEVMRQIEVGVLQTLPSAIIISMVTTIWSKMKKLRNKKNAILDEENSWMRIERNIRKIDKEFSNHDYILSDDMERIFEASREEIQPLRINYRCSSNIVGILNNLYNDEKFFQQPNKSSGKVNPTIVITNDFSESFMEQFKDYMQLYLFNRERFEKIGASDLYSALSDMKAYKFPSQYTPVDVLTDTTNDNPDKLFRILFCVCDFIKMVSMAAYGKSIQFAREKKQIFNSGFTNIEFHNDKIIFYDKVQKLEEAYDLSTMTIQGFCEFLTDNEYCNKDIFLPFIEDTEYEKVLKVSLSQLHALYAYLGAPSVSTQHGVKGEGHNNVCFIAEDSTRNPIVYMYEFFQLLCAEDINLTDFQNFYYDYVSEIKSINLTYLKPAKTYKAHEGEYLQYAQYIKNKYKDNKYFLFCQQKYYDKYLGNPNSTNAKDCFKSTKIQGILWAYKLFYVGCSRAKENLVIVIDENKIAPFRKEFIKRMTAIGFDVNGI